MGTTLSPFLPITPSFFQIFTSILQSINTTSLLLLIVWCIPQYKAVCDNMFNYCVFENHFWIQHFFSSKYTFDYFNPQKSCLFSSCNYHFIHLMFSKITLLINNPFVVCFSRSMGKILEHGFACSETCCVHMVWERLLVEKYCLYSIPPLGKGMDPSPKKGEYYIIQY
jgi:hypothetical protein